MLSCDTYIYIREREREREREPDTLLLCLVSRSLLKMPLVTCYRHLEKKNFGETDFQKFCPLRAVGLAVELGWKLSRERGFGNLGATDLRQVGVGGELRFLTEGRWRKVQRCTLQLTAQDAQFANTAVQKQATLLGDLGLNTWVVDAKRADKRRPFDLVCCFNPGKKNFGVEGKLWVELKVWGEARFDDELAEWKEKLSKELRKEQGRDCNLGGVLLLAARVGRAGGSFQAPALVAALRTVSSDAWLELSGSLRKAARGQCKTKKKPLQEVWDEMEWPLTAQRQKVGLFRHFLAALGLAVNNAGQRAGTMNTLLQQRQVSGRVFEANLAQKAGRKPWVATKATLRALYNYL